MKKLFSFSEGIYYFNKSPSCIELFCFASNDRYIYDQKRSKLNRFMYYFKDQAKGLIEAAEKEKIYVPLRKIDEPSQESEGKNHEFYERTKIKRYYLSGLYLGVYLTSREVECLN